MNLCLNLEGFISDVCPKTEFFSVKTAFLTRKTVILYRKGVKLMFGI